MLDYRFNEYRGSKEQVTNWTKRAYQLMRIESGYFSGQTMGEMLYSHFVKGETLKEISNRYRGFSYQHIRTILSGRFSPEAFIIFHEMLEHEPEVLDDIYTVKTIRGGTNND